MMRPYEGPSTPRWACMPLVVAPTATDEALGADAWQLGAAGIYFDLSSPTVQWGGLVTW